MSSPWRHRLCTSLFATLLAVLTGVTASRAAAPDAGPDAQWQANYDARASFFVDAVGPLPPQIQKMVTLTGVWPGGGFFVIPAAKLDPAANLYTTFGLTNPDMPAKTRLQGATPRPDAMKSTEEAGAASAANGEPYGSPPASTVEPFGSPPASTVEPQAVATASPEVAGYGYELAVLAHAEEKWPIGFLQWAVDAEIVNDVGFLRQVEEKGGLTIENVRIGAAKPLHVVIARARSPLPAGADLPAGRMTLLIATAITAEELRWSREHGSAALLEKLVEGGVGQRSALDRPAVVRQ